MSQCWHRLLPLEHRRIFELGIIIGIAPNPKRSALAVSAVDLCFSDQSEALAFDQFIAEDLPRLLEAGA